MWIIYELSKIEYERHKCPFVVDIGLLTQLEMYCSQIITSIWMSLLHFGQKVDASLKNYKLKHILELKLNFTI